MSEILNFGAGPAKLPEEVLLQVQKELITYGDSGISVMELSHRSASYDKIHNDTIATVKRILYIPDNYTVLLMPGGGTAQFSAICLNFMGKTGTADYFITGSWSKKAAVEAKKYGKVNMVIPQRDKHVNIPPKSEWNLDPNASYVYYCDNETIDGVEFDTVPETNGVPLICDMSSNILTRKFDITKFALVFAGAQKNIGPSGVTLVIVRNDMLGNAHPMTPLMLDYNVMKRDNSIHNTPPTFNIYVLGLVFKWIEDKGGLDEMQKLSKIKSKLVYDAIDGSNGFYYAPVEKIYRSRTNIPFRIGGAAGNAELEKAFIKGAEELGMIQLKGHRSVGGIRASLYNAVNVDETKKLVQFMNQFLLKHAK